MIFISHNYKDKPFIEHIASKISEIYGQDKVFYDSWSIQPGDGIIDRMNTGLGEAKFFFFFVTKNSLESKMVTLEWQNALMNAAQGNLKFIPIKCDDSAMPAILIQTLYLNLYTDGVEAITAQMKNIIDKKSTFNPKTEEFSNLKIEYYPDEKNILHVTVSAEYFIEVISECIFVFENKITAEGINLDVPESMFLNNFIEKITLNDGKDYNAYLVGLTRGITTKMPLTFKIWMNDGSEMKLKLALHKQSPTEWKPIPMKNPPFQPKTFVMKY